MNGWCDYKMTTFTEEFLRRKTISPNTIPSVCSSEEAHGVLINPTQIDGEGGDAGPDKGVSAQQKVSTVSADEA